MSALDQFKEVVERFGTIAGFAIGGTALVPLVTAATGLAPPWPAGLPFVACVLMLITLVLIFHFLTRRRALFSMVLLVGSILLVTSLAAHVYLHSQFVTVAPRSNAPLILGCKWTRDAVVVANDQGIDTSDQCPGDYRALLEDAEYDSSEIWTPGSISNVAYLLAVTWTLVFIALALALGSFVIWYSRQPAGRRRAAPTEELP